MNRPPPNQFLRHLFARSNTLLSHCGPATALIILAPVSSSLNLVDADTGLVFGDNLTDEFVQSHILRVSHARDEVVERAKARVYSTVNGKTLVIKDDAVFPHRGFRGVKEVKILHDSLLWPDDPNAIPYLVYFLDRPLVGNAIPAPASLLVPTPSQTRRTIASWADLVSAYNIIGSSLGPIYARLFLEFNEALQEEDHHQRPQTASHTSSSSTAVATKKYGRFASSGARAPSVASGAASSTRRPPRRRSNASASSPPLPNPSRMDTSHSFSQSPTLQFVRVRVDLVLNAAIQAFQSLPQSLLHTVGTDTCLTGPEIESMIEKHMLDELYDIVFFKITGITQAQDEHLASAIQLCGHVDLVQLGTSSSPDLRKRHGLALERFRGFGERLGPLHKIAALIGTIEILMRDSEKSSDDLIPSLVSVVIKAGVSNLYANILWIREFAFADVDSGEYGFALSTLEAVLYHITSSVKTLSKASNLNRTFLSAVESGNQDLVVELLDASPELIDIRDSFDRTPHRLASQEMLDLLLSRPCNVSNLSDLLLENLHTPSFRSILTLALSLEPQDQWLLLNQADETGQSLAHKIHEKPEILEDVWHQLDWRLKDNQGNTPLQVLVRIYDHPMYETLLEAVLSTITRDFPSDDRHSPGHRAAPGGESADEMEDVVDSASMEESEMEEVVTETPPSRSKIPLIDHIDAKGNTLAHIVSTLAATKTIFAHCTGNFNLTNNKGLTPLLISIKFARSASLEFLLARPEIDAAARDSRGHSAIHYAARASLGTFNTCVRAGLDINDRAVGSGVTPLHIASREGNIPVLKKLLVDGAEEAWDWRGFRAGDIVKNDAVRSIMDTWACREREVRVLRGHVGEDCTVKYLVKSKSGGGVLRSVAEFLTLRMWMTARYPALGVATLNVHMPSPCLLHSRPSRSVLLATTERLDAFVQSLLDHEIISQNPILWEFLLSPTVNEKVVARKIEAEVEKERASIWSDEKVVSSYDSTRTFFDHASEQVMQLSSTYRIFERKARAVKDGQLHLAVAYGLVGKSLSPIPVLSPHHITALESMSDTLLPKEPSLLYRLIEDAITLDARISGLLHTLTIPPTLVSRLTHLSECIDRHERDLSKTPRLASLIPFTDSTTRRKESIKDRLKSLHVDLSHAGSELRYNETVCADSLSSFYASHEGRVRHVLKRFVKTQVSVEKGKLLGLQKIMRTLRETTASDRSGDGDDDGGAAAAMNQQGSW